MRPESLFPLFASVAQLKGVGPRLLPLVERAAGPLVRDLAFLAPIGVIDREPTVISAARDGAVVTLRVTIKGHQVAVGSAPYKIRAADPTGPITLQWFKGHGEHLARSHPVGTERVVSGKVEVAGGQARMAHPDFMVALERAGDIPRREAVYPTTAGLAARTLGKLAREALGKAPDLAEWQDPAWRARKGWPSWREALALLHSPAGTLDLGMETPHRARLAFDELLAHQLALASRKVAKISELARAIPASDLSARMEAALPFSLTGAQVRTLSEIRNDLVAGQRMSRLVQGDVGSGKTVLAMLAAADVAASGCQTAFMAPTEILARQHFETIAEPLEQIGIRVVLLTGRDKGLLRAEKLALLASGKAGVAVGTHALFQDEVVFADLALAVVDEQHRFGVSERRRLLAKGDAVHVLALSATPIPRTLELTAYGDLDVSRIDEKPPGRKPVVTTAIPSARIDEIIVRLQNAVASGAQAFWICPLVTESETLDVMAAEARAAELREHLGPKVGLVHGQMPATEKDRVMAAFADGTVPVLVATTVVEVGVNVPAATIMIIEHAERFGLAQLHQLRGRVGRGAGASACVLLYDPPLSKAAQARLEILRETDDGFLIAERDLELRGGGDMVGLKQSGFPAYRFADPVVHRDLILAAADDARLVLARDPDLTSPRGQAIRVLQALFDWRVEGGWEAAG